MKIPVKELVVCEGKYDKIKLDSIIDGVVISLDGFGIFKNEEMRALIKRASESVGVIVVTDSDSAGMVIRNHIKSFTREQGVIHLYTPVIMGKEKRKTHASKEGKLGVEGIPADILRECFLKISKERQSESVTRFDLYKDGFIGREGSVDRRRELLRRLSLPEEMSTKALLSALTLFSTKEEYMKICEDLK